MGLDFVAIDFETANNNRGSACAVGMVRIRGGEVAARESFLVKPAESLGGFATLHMGIHKITPDQVVDAPGWAEVLPRIVNFVQSDFLVAHNAPFDVSVITSATDERGLVHPDMTYFCTLDLARSAMPKLSDHKLKTVSAAMKLGDFKHHDAEDDAWAAAMICVRLAEFAKVDDLASLMKGYGVRSAQIGRGREYSVFDSSELPALQWGKSESENHPPVTAKSMGTAGNDVLSTVPVVIPQTRRERRKMEAEPPLEVDRVSPERPIKDHPEAPYAQEKPIRRKVSSQAPDRALVPPVQTTLSSNNPTPPAYTGGNRSIISDESGSLANVTISVKVLDWRWWLLAPVLFIMTFALSAAGDFKVLFALTFMSSLFSQVAVIIAYFVRKSKIGTRSGSNVSTEVSAQIAALKETIRLKDESHYAVKAYDDGIIASLRHQQAAALKSLNASHEKSVATIERGFTKQSGSLEKSIRNLELENTEKDARLLLVQAKVTNLESENTRLRTEAADKDAMLSDTRKKLTVVTGDLATTKMVLAGFQTRMEEAEDASAKQESEIARLLSNYHLASEVASRYNISDILSMEEDRAELRIKTDAVRQELSELEAQLQTTRDEIIADEVGLFDFDHVADSSVRLAGDLAEVRSDLKAMVRRKAAYSYDYGFEFNGSVAEGQKFCERMAKIMLNAYNAESENAVKSLRNHDNSYAAKTKIIKSRERMTKNGQMIGLVIDDEYHALRLREVEIASRHLLMLKVEREVQRELREEAREQDRVDRELQEERDRLDKERQHYLNTLRAVTTNGDEEAVARMQEKIEEIDDAIENVVSRVANTKAGHVYIISNVGAFGEGIVKIGMTRRLNPMDRVKELGDASVPFRFDTHALFFAADAVSIENTLHKHFAPQRVNRVNLRREFFYTTPSAVLEALKEHNVEIVEFQEEFSAEEFRISQEIMQQELAA